MKAFILSILLDLLKYLFILMLIIENLSQADLQGDNNSIHTNADSQENFFRK